MKIASRIEKLPPYVFAGMAKKLAELRASGVDVINFGMGDPDVPTPQYLVDAMLDAVPRPENAYYPGYFGKAELRRAISGWYANRFGVELDPDKEVLPLIGSKEGIANIALAFVDPGEAALVPDPSYPVYKYGTLMTDGVVVPLPLYEENGWLPDFDSLPASLGHEVNVLWLNYPNNPTGAVAGLEFFERAVHWAKHHDVIIAHDNPYSDVTYDGYLAPSIFEIPEARELAIEFNSLSKTYSMAGYRIGMAVGNAQIIEVLGRIKTNIDSGIYGAVQDAAIAALTGDQSWIPKRNLIYARRRDKLCQALAGIGIVAPKPKASLYIWARVPQGFTSKRFADWVLDSTGVAVTPGSSYGEQGEGYFRMSLTVPDAQVDQACQRLANLKLDGQPGLSGDGRGNGRSRHETEPKGVHAAGL